MTIQAPATPISGFQELRLVCNCGSYSKIRGCKHLQSALYSLTDPNWKTYQPKGSSVYLVCSYYTGENGNWHPVESPQNADFTVHGLYVSWTDARRRAREVKHDSEVGYNGWESDGNGGWTTDVDPDSSFKECRTLNIEIRSENINPSTGASDEEGDSEEESDSDAD